MDCRAIGAAAPALPTLSKAFGEAVHRLRKKIQPSQEKFAAKAGISRTYVSEIERGVTNVSLDTVDRVAKALGLSLAELFLDVDVERGARGQAHATPNQEFALPPRTALRVAESAGLSFSTSMIHRN